MKETLTQLVNDGLSNIEIGKLLNVHRTTVGKLLVKHDVVRDKVLHTECGICSKSLGENKKNSCICNSCMTRIRRYRTKKKAVEYLGGKCSKCGYDKNLSSLEFHHRDPKEKDFTISNQGNKSWKVIKKELDKCKLLCSNCHHEEHNKYEDHKLLDYIDKFGL